jgi:hypothetical protein
LPEGFEQLEHLIPRIAAIDSFKANFLYLSYGNHIVLVVDMAKTENLGGFYLLERISCKTLCHA